jgi:hypothetical protein
MFLILRSSSGLPLGTCKTTRTHQRKSSRPSLKVRLGLRRSSDMVVGARVRVAQVRVAQEQGHDVVSLVTSFSVASIA